MASVDARLVRPGKRGGWVAGHLSWGRLDALRHYGHPDAHVRLLQEFYATYRRTSPNATGYYRYSYAGYSHGDGKTISRPLGVGRVGEVRVRDSRAEACP